MKKVIFLLPVFLYAVACNDKETTGTESKDSSATTSTDYTSYPYTIKNPDTWETGDKKHTLNVLKSLKAYETGNTDEAASYFADSVRLRFDEIDAKVSNDSLKAMFKKWRGENKSVTVEMHDWESVRSKDKNEEWVSIWYTQTWEDNKGIKDSVSVMDDLKIENGKIIELDEKTRKFPKKK